MKLLSTTTQTLALLLPTVHSATTCTYTWITGYTREFTISASNAAADVSAACTALWDNLRREASCASPQSTYCGEQSAGTLTWRFRIGQNCDEAMVEGAWLQGTAEKLGGIMCMDA